MQVWSLCRETWLDNHLRINRPEISSNWCRSNLWLGIGISLLVACECWRKLTHVAAPGRDSAVGSIHQDSSCLLVVLLKLLNAHEWNRNAQLSSVRWLALARCMMTTICLRLVDDGCRRPDLKSEIKVVLVMCFLCVLRSRLCCSFCEMAILPVMTCFRQSSSYTDGRSKRTCWQQLEA